MYAESVDLLMLKHAASARYDWCRLVRRWQRADTQSARDMFAQHMVNEIDAQHEQAIALNKSQED